MEVPSVVWGDVFGCRADWDVNAIRSFVAQRDERIGGRGAARG
jgi:hypothetical protein